MLPLKRIFSLFFACFAAVASGLTICSRCGYEAEGGTTVCSHCGGDLPSALPPAVAETTGAVPATALAPGLAEAAFETAKSDVLHGRKLAAARPELALASFANALALMRLAPPDQVSQAGRGILDAMQRCRAGLGVTESACLDCEGTGRKRIRVVSLTPGEESFADASTAACESCRGSGRQRSAGRGADAMRLRLMQGRRDYDLLAAADGRVQMGFAWVPADWPGKLDIRQIAAVRHAAAGTCDGCMGLSVTDCRACGGSGRSRCTACRDGWIERRSINDLTPQTALRQRERCTACNGSGRVACSACRGTAVVACSQCRGLGTRPLCTACGGEGTALCRACRGGTERRTPCASCGGARIELCGTCRGDGYRLR